MFRKSFHYEPSLTKTGQKKRLYKRPENNNGGTSPAIVKFYYIKLAKLSEFWNYAAELADTVGNITGPVLYKIKSALS